MKKTTIIVISGILLSFAVFARLCPAESDLKPEQIIPLEPVTIEDKLNSSQLAVYGQVVSVVEEQSQGVEIGNRKSALKNFVANVKVLETFKGGVTGDTLSVLFTESSMRTQPPLIMFTQGEKCILFLLYAENGRFSTLTPSTGKEYASDALLNELRTKTGSAEKGKGGIIALLKGGDSADADAVFVTLTIINNTNGEVPVFSGVANVADISVTGPDGKKVSPKQYSRLTAGDAAQSFLLASGHFIGARINLSNLFEFKTPGKYIISARVPTPKGGGSPRAADLISNSVTVSIANKNP
jgi:hypothetical protein